MTVFRDAKNLVTKPGSQVHWVKLVIAFVGLILISFGFAALLSFAKSCLNINLYEFELLACISVFVATLLANMTIIAPVPFAIAIMATAAKEFNPLTIALAAALGGTIGELSGYYAGRLGRKIAVPDSIINNQRVEHWVRKYGIWSITVLAFQPIVPFDMGGLVAGAARMPLHYFLPALFAGKFPKYILLTYGAVGFTNVIHLPSWLS
ncbi:MAG: VTT domain-containing protein [Dehalococcoidales bacterium]|nr:VTT domain-containing protein [Dehalococcoidales bacterium]